MSVSTELYNRLDEMAKEKKISVNKLVSDLIVKNTGKAR